MEIYQPIGVAVLEMQRGKFLFDKKKKKKSKSNVPLTLELQP